MKNDNLNQETAISRFLQINSQIQEMIKELQTLSDNHFNKSPDDIYWGDVGDMARIYQMLKEVLLLAKNETTND